MRHAALFHNPRAGDEEHAKKSIVALIQSKGFDVTYFSAQKARLNKVEDDIDFIIVAGGDGTVRTITKELLERKIIDKTWPIALLPFGTANNIAKTLQIPADTEQVIESWHQNKMKKYDVGKLEHITNAPFFLESFGYGIFPYLMHVMKEKKLKKNITPEEKIQTALNALHDIIINYQPRNCSLLLDGINYSGTYLLAEIMNIQSIGPNLFLAAQADPGDGEFDVVLVEENDKEKFANYVKNKLNGIESPYVFKTIRAKNIEISWQGTHVHVDDEIVKIKESETVTIEMKEGLLSFMV